MKNYLFEKFMYGIRMPIRAIVLVIKDKMTLEDAFRLSIELTTLEIGIVYHFEKMEAK